MSVCIPEPRNELCQRVMGGWDSRLKKSSFWSMQQIQVLLILPSPSSQVQIWRENFQCYKPWPWSEYKPDETALNLKREFAFKFEDFCCSLLLQRAKFTEERKKTRKPHILLSVQDPKHQDTYLQLRDEQQICEIWFCECSSAQEGAGEIVVCGVFQVFWGTGTSH